jgi:hypothetical protein
VGACRRIPCVPSTAATAGGARASGARPGQILEWRPPSLRDKLSARVLSVVATKIRTCHGVGGPSSTVGRIYEGYLLSSPVVGRGMVIFRDPNGRRMVTTAVRRVLTTGEDNVLYVETENSVYRIAIRDEQPAIAIATG